MVKEVSTGHKNLGHFMRREMSNISPIVVAVKAFLILFVMNGSALAGDTGPVTNLPMPRFVSLKAVEGNVRRGPSLSHRIDWVFTRRDMPLRITAEHGHWRRVEDRDGLGGWVHYSLLSGTRTVLIEQDMLTIRTRPEPQAPVAAALEAGVIARLGKCDPEWCRLTAAGYKGWAPKARLWGVAMDEVRD
jgi:SH3-like domain-containing protein